MIGNVVKPERFGSRNRCVETLLPLNGSAVIWTVRRSKRVSRNPKGLHLNIDRRDAGVGAVDPTLDEKQGLRNRAP